VTRPRLEVGRKRAFSFDAAGNPTQDMRGTTTYDYAVDNAGRNATLTFAGSLHVTYTYHAFQRLRVKAPADLCRAVRRSGTVRNSVCVAGIMGRMEIPSGLRQRTCYP